MPIAPAPTSVPTRSPRRAVRALVTVIVTLAVSVLAGGGATWAVDDMAVDGRSVDGMAAATPGLGRWAPPVTPLRVAHGFEPPAQRWLPGHRGIDLSAPAGAVVRAVDDGVVVFAGDVAGTPVVSVDHRDGLRSTYQPVHADVAAGDVVLRGQQLGTLSTTASHCAPATCLHLGARRSQTYLDPALLLGLRGPRLLPFLSGADAWPASVDHATADTDAAAAPAPQPHSEGDDQASEDDDRAAATATALLAATLAALRPAVLGPP